MKKEKLILLLHGYDASGGSHFLPALNEALSTYGEVLCPDLPHSNMPVLTEWKEAIKQLVNGRTVDLVVGHSLGGVAVMQMITSDEIEVKNLVTIGSSPGWKDVDQMNNFIIPPVSFQKLKDHLRNMIVVHSYDDPHCAFEYGMILIKQAGAKGMFFGDQGHFCIKQLPEPLINLMKSFLL